MKRRLPNGTFKAVADALGVSVSTVAKVARGERSNAKVEKALLQEAQALMKRETRRRRLNILIRQLRARNKNGEQA